MNPHRRVLPTPASRYAVALAAVLLAQLLRAVALPLAGARLPFLFFFPAIMAATWIGGLGPGVVAFLASAVLGGLVFEPRIGSWMSTPGDWAAYALFIPVGAAIVLAVEGARRARELAEIRRETLDQALDAARMGYWTLDVSAGRVAWSDNFEAVHRLPQGSLGSSLAKFLELVHPEDAPRMKTALERATREGADFDLSFRIQPPEAPLQWIHGQGHAIVRGGRAVQVTGVDTNVTGRRDDEQAARLLAAIVSSSEDAIISKDLQGRVLSWNAAAERLFGYRADEMVGRSIQVLMPPERAEDYLAIINRIARGERVEHYETVRRRKDGTFVEVAVTASPVHDENGRIVAVSKTARDLSVWREIERDRERTRELFLATLGHDLRNPLNAITASLFYLRRHAPDSLHHVVDRMTGSSDRMARMIGQLLDFTRTRLGGGIEINPQPGDLRQVCRTVLGELEAQYADRLRFAAGGELPGDWDADRLAQVVSNLVVNALDHGSAGDPVAIATRRDGDEAVLEVSNRGDAIPEAMREAIFQPFRRGAGEQRKPSRGLGLGLYISREIVRAHGGSIRVGCEDGCVRFVVRLPMRGAAKRETLTRVPLLLPAAGPRPRA
jgi:PAS domain S-box-containing protein